MVLMGLSVLFSLFYSCEGSSCYFHVFVVGVWILLTAMICFFCTIVFIQ